MLEEELRVIHLYYDTPVGGHKGRCKGTSRVVLSKF